MGPLMHKAMPRIYKLSSKYQQFEWFHQHLLTQVQISTLGLKGPCIEAVVPSVLQARKTEVERGQYRRQDDKGQE